MAVSVRDVAALAGVSVGTVSNVLNRPEKVAPATVERVQGAIGELGFVRNDAARQLRAGRSSTLAMVVLDVANPFFTDVARGAEERAAEDGLTVLLGNSDDQAEREALYLEQFEQQRVRGVLITPVAEDMPLLRQLRERGTPVVLVDREVGDRTFSSVAVDDVAGGRLAVEHLLDGGRRRIAYVGGPVGTRQVIDRLSGARRAVAAVDGASLETVETRALTVHQGREAGEAIAGRDRADRPDAIFAANDLLAIGVLQGLQRSKVEVPTEVALIGYDDIDFVQSTVVPLSSIKQPAHLIGRTAVELLLQDAAGAGSPPEQVVFDPELVVRESTQTT
ncbi:LacI family DNA-binding transcriptional regulator [Pseudactinotalea sp. HY158]|uniref:LacI family DNA-binding transcriptional regulator n=1 Tax=Pseudactinotalea sp. HY158 TaxID=2654547 RepID=UPI00129CBC3C|nr:LacI family DNA-binding transcriptional regulator [Pseudactinotalea sp. HY158]QGH70004.1 substrate-binding domain-containing protein [Pseudactinotalea sp. HY158]